LRLLYRLVALRHRPRFGLLADEVIFRVGGYVLGNVATSIVAIVTSYLTAAGPRRALRTGVLGADRRAGPHSPGRVLDRRCCGRPGHGLADVVAGHGGLPRLLPAVRGLPAQPAGAAKNGGRVPLVTVAAVVLGGALLGIVGAVVAVPAAAAVQLVLVEVVYPNRDRAGG